MAYMKVQFYHMQIRTNQHTGIRTITRAPFLHTIEFINSKIINQQMFIITRIISCIYLLLPA